MTLAKLKKRCAALLNVASADFTVDSEDIFLGAANNAITNAQLLHNFEASRVLATLSVDGVTGGRLSDAVVAGNTNETLTVTGTLSPDATGTYIRQGEFSGYPLYILEGSTPFFIFYNSNLATYVLDSTLTTGAPSNYWLIAPDALSAVGAYTAAGTNTGTATVASASVAAWNGLSEIVAIYRNNAEGALVPLDFTRPDIAIERDRYELEMSEEYEPYRRYPSDAALLDRGSNGTLILRGNTLYLHPPATTSSDDFEVYLEGYGRLAEYTATSLSLSTEQDFLLTHGATFMQWSIIHELNFLFKTFVPRTEGNLNPPEREREKAWRDLILWDTYLVDANSTRSR
jgi:hypothetical protein